MGAISTQKLQITRTPSQRTTETESHSTLAYTTLCTFTPLLFCLCFCFALFPIQGLCQFGPRSHHRQNMYHQPEHVGHWEGLEMWLSATTNSILPKAAEALQHQTQTDNHMHHTSIIIVILGKHIATMLRHNPYSLLRSTARTNLVERSYSQFFFFSIII